MTVCQECLLAKQGRGKPVQVSADVVDMASCDGQQLAGAHVGASVSKDGVAISVRAPSRPDPVPAGQGS